MNALLRRRGLISAHAETPDRVFAELRESVDGFKRHHTAELSNLTSAVDNINSQLAAMKVGGVGGGSALDGMNQYSEANAAFAKFARTGDADAMTAMRPNNAMSTDDDGNGGYLAPSEIDKIIALKMLPISPMRRLATVVQTSKSAWSRLMEIDGISSGWVGETDGRPETPAPKFREITPPIGEIYANPAVTQRLLDDSFTDVSSYLTDALNGEFATQENSAFVVGDGVKKPRGFLTLPMTLALDGARPYGTWQYIKTGNAAGFKALDTASQSYPADCLSDLVYGVAAQYRSSPNAAWQMNSTTAGIISKFKDAGGNYLWRESLINGQPASLLGYPVEINDFFPDIGANAYPIGFGDWSRGYIIVDRIGIRILRDPYTNKPYVYFYATKRVGGAPFDTRAVKFIKCEL